MDLGQENEYLKEELHNLAAKVANYLFRSGYSVLTFLSSYIYIYILIYIYPLYYIY